MHQIACGSYSRRSCGGEESELGELAGLSGHGYVVHVGRHAWCSWCSEQMSWITSSQSGLVGAGFENVHLHLAHGPFAALMMTVLHPRQVTLKTVEAQTLQKKTS